MRRALVMVAVVSVCLASGLGCTRRQARYNAQFPGGPMPPYAYGNPYAYGYVPSPYPAPAAAPAVPAYARPYGPPAPAGPAPVAGYVQTFCGKCGQPVLAGPPPGLSCPYCGTINYYK